MSAVFSVLAGIGGGFILNIVPKKVMYILTFALALFVILGFALLSDAKYNITGNWDWTTVIFGFVGYWVGYVIAYAVKEVKEWGW
jgi:hypothetical protein